MTSHRIANDANRPLLADTVTLKEIAHGVARLGAYAQPVLNPFAIQRNLLLDRVGVGIIPTELLDSLTIARRA